MACDYCNGFSVLVRCSHRLSSKGNFYPGISAGIDDGELWIESIADTYEPSFMSEYIKINFCPMCGDRLSEDNI